MRRAFVHLSRFPVQRRVMETPSLAGKPLALVENQRGHVRVAFASTAALRAGVRPGMTKTAACALVPELPCLPYDAQAERRALVSLGEALLQLGPQFQLCEPEGLFLDAAAAHLFGGEEGLCRRIGEVCQTHGYRAKVAVASEAFTARALARHGEWRRVCVPPEESACALAPLPLSALEGAALASCAPLRALGLSTLGEVAGLPVGVVVARLGSEGLFAHRLCRGEDDSPLVPEPLAEVLEEKVELDWPAEAMEPLLFGLKTLLDRLCARLCGRAQAAVRLDFVLKLDPGGEVLIPLRLARPSSQAKLLLELARHQLADVAVPNPVAGLRVRVVESSEDRGQQLPLGDAPQGDAALEVVLSRLTTTLGEEALFCAALSEAHRPEAAYQARAFSPPQRERGVLEEARRLSSHLPQPAAGPEPKRKKARAQQALPGITEENAWLFGGPSQMDEPRAVTAAAGPAPEPAGATGTEADGGEDAWGPAPVSLAAWAKKAGAQSVAPAPAPAPLSGAPASSPSSVPGTASGAPLPLPSLPPERAETLSARPSRFFSRPATLEAEVAAGGELQAARLLGRRRKVEAVAGPERLSGEWWEAEYARDYYRVHFEGLGPVWIFRDERDGRFYLHGMFD